MTGGIFEASICVSYSVVPEVYTSSGRFFFVLLAKNCAFGVRVRVRVTVL